MQMSQDEKFIRFSTGLNNSQLLPITTNLYKDLNLNRDKDYYVSLYKYNKKHKEEFNKTKSVKGIRDVTTNKLVFDFDDLQDIHNARKDAVILCARLVESGVNEENIRIYFSGKKGFAVEVILTEELTRQEFVNIVFGLASDLPTFDVRINDEARIIRMPLSKHQESGLYKIPLHISELSSLSLEDIFTLASDILPGTYDTDELSEDLYAIDLTDRLIELKNKTFKKVIDKSIAIQDNAVVDANSIDFSNAPKWMAKERFALQEGHFFGSKSVGKGERNIAFMILAATYKNQGFSADHALALLLVTAKKQSLITGEEEYTEDKLQREIINEVYSHGWQGGVYSSDEELLVKTRQRFELGDPSFDKSDLVDIQQIGKDFQMFAREIDRNTIKTGLKSLDDSCLITSGMMVSLLAAPGAGKTSFASLFVENLSKSGETTLFFSLDMYQPLIFNRLLQKYSGYSMAQILNMYKDNEPDEVLLDAYSKVVANYSNVQFNFRTGLTIEEIEKDLILYQEQSGKKVKLLVIDYLEKVRGPFADSTANSAYIASRLSDLAKKYHLTLLLLVQPAKVAGDPRDELNSYRKIKGSSTIEQDSRVVLTLSRPGYDPRNMENDKFACISVVKNNMGPLNKLDYFWDGVKGDFTELDSAGRRELKDLRDSIEDEKKHQDDI